MKLIIAGSRTFTNKDIVFSVINSILLPKKSLIDEVVCGMARGVDLFGKEWAEEHGIPVKEFPYLSQYGKAGGPMRNKQMAEYATHALVIWDGISKGTRNMIDQMKKINKPCCFVTLTPELYNHLELKSFENDGQ